MEPVPVLFVVQGGHEQIGPDHGQPSLGEAQLSLQALARDRAGPDRWDHLLHGE
jgi:hypothetical protein